MCNQQGKVVMRYSNQSITENCGYAAILIVFDSIASRPYWPTFFILQAHVGPEYKRALQVCSGALATAVVSHHLTTWALDVYTLVNNSLASLGSLLHYFYASTTSMPAVARPREDRKQKTLETIPQDSSQNWNTIMTICHFIRPSD